MKEHQIGLGSLRLTKLGEARKEETQQKLQAQEPQEAHQT